MTAYPKLKTKYCIPAIDRRQLLRRPELVQRLHAAQNVHLTVISAPAGYGKTTLLAEWVHTLDEPVGWVSLDALDNKIARFWGHVIHGLQTIRPGTGQDALDMLNSIGPNPQIEKILTYVINELAESDAIFTVILDDFHLITDKKIHRSIQFLLNYMPKQFHLVLASRTSIPFGLGRLRATGRLSEIKADCLRLSSEEVSLFMEQLMGVSLGHESFRALADCAEGWITGLKILAMAYQTRPSDGTAIDIRRAFSTSHQQIMEYFIEEVLWHYPDDLQRFLLTTCLLERLNGELCNAVTGRADGIEILEKMSRLNIFIFALDEDHRWYRYHHLFSSSLQKHLAKSLSREAIQTIHRKASRWFRHNKLHDEAVAHAIAAKDWEQVADLLAHYSPAALNKGEISKVLGWMESLPEEIWPDRPLLCVIHAWALYLKYFSSSMAAPILKKIDDLLTVVEHFYEAEMRSGKSMAEGESFIQKEILNYAGTLRISLAKYRRESPRKIIGLANDALSRLNGPSDLLKAIIHVQLGFELYILEDYEAAFDAFEKARSLRFDHRLYIIGAVASGVQILITNKLGKLRDAMQLCRYANEQLEVIRSQKQTYEINRGFVNFPLACFYFEMNDLQKSLDLLNDGLEKSRLVHFEFLMIDYLALKTWIRFVQKADAREISFLLSEVEYLMRVGYGKLNYAKALRVRFLIHQSQDAPELLNTALDTAKALKPLLTDTDRRFLNAIEFDWCWLARTTLIRLYIAQIRLLPLVAPEMQLEDILGFLQKWIDIAERKAIQLKVIELMILKALAHDAVHDRHAALRALQRAFHLAEPQGYVRIFLNEGKPMAALLKRAMREGIGAGYAKMLLLEMSKESEMTACAPGALMPDTGLIEPLSRRELDILRLLAQGFSNQQIADRLCLSVPTVKWHNYNIFGKLNVGNRSLAILKARKLDLIPS